jgi:hypothetical protein
LVRWNAAAEGLDEGFPKEGPVACTKSVESLAELARAWVDVTNDFVDLLLVRELASVRMVSEFFQEIFKRSETSREVRCDLRTG